MTAWWRRLLRRPAPRPAVGTDEHPVPEPPPGHDLMHNWSTRVVFLYDEGPLTLSTAVLIPQVTARDGLGPDSHDHTVRLLTGSGMTPLNHLTELPAAFLRPMRGWRVALGPTRGRITAPKGVLLTDGLRVEPQWAEPVRNLGDHLAILYTTDIAPTRMDTVGPTGDSASLLEEAIARGTLLAGVARVMWSHSDP